MNVNGKKLDFIISPVFKSAIRIYKLCHIISSFSHPCILSTHRHVLYNFTPFPLFHSPFSIELISSLVSIYKPVKVTVFSLSASIPPLSRTYFISMNDEVRVIRIIAQNQPYKA